MAALRLLWFTAILGEAYSFPLTFDRLAYEFAKDIITYGMLTCGCDGACATCFARAPAPAAETGRRPPHAIAAGIAARALRGAQARRQRGHGRGGRHRLDRGRRQLRDPACRRRHASRSVPSLTKLEGELDPKRFVRVHKSYVVNIARIAEVTPWISGDWRIRLQDGAEVNLSRRYRQRFEALVPVRS